MTQIAAVTPELQTSPIYRIKGQKSRWTYPDQRFTPENCEKLRNVNLSELGIAEDRGGYAEYNSTDPTAASANAVTGLIQAEWSTGTQQIECTETKVYYDDATTRTDITGSLTLSAGGDDDFYRFAFINDKLVATNGKDETWYKDSDFTAPTNATALTGMPWTTCEDLIAHRGILIALAPTESGTKQPTRIRWCDIDTRFFVPTITTWPDGNRFEVYEGGTPIIGGVDAWGGVLVFKGDGLYPGKIEYDAGFLEYRMNPQEIRRGFHPLAKNSLIARPEFVFGIAREGAFAVTPDLQVEIITKDIQDEWDGSLNLSRLKYGVSWIREREHQVRTLLSKSGTGSGHDIVLVWDWETGDVWFDELTANMNFASQIFISDAELDWMGGQGGKFYKAPSTNEDDGASYEWTVWMQPNDLGLPGKTKTIVNFRTIYDFKSNQDSAALTLFRNRGKLGSFTSTIDFAGNAAKWNDGSATWNDGSQWGGGSNQEIGDFVNLQAETIAPRWVGNSPVKLIGYQVEFIPEE